MSQLPWSVFRRSRRVHVILISLFVGLCAATLFLVPWLRWAVRANRVDVSAVAHMFPKFTAEQRLAIHRQVQSNLHPLGRDVTLEELVMRFAKYLATPFAGSTQIAPAANFIGNLTTAAVNSSDMMILAQQPNCSLNLDDLAYTLNPIGPTFSYTLAGSTPNYQQVLHSAAGLTTTQGSYPAGCGDTNVGVSSRKIVFAGVTTASVRVYAEHFYDAAVGYDQIAAITANAGDAFQAFTLLNDANSVIDLATADLNGDGNGDLVSIDNSNTTGDNAIATIFLGAANGTFSSTPTQITLQGSYAISAVIDDFNGDGKKDLIVSTESFPPAGGTTYYINFLAGKGDGTFQTVQSYAEIPPAATVGATSAPYFGLISKRLRASGHTDLITSAGIVLFGNGDGTFSQSATLAFPSTTATSSYGPNVVAADFNKDGIPDLALDNGETIQVFLGNGDGTFTLKSAYSTVDNIGYLVPQDIDGDGNIDLYSGAGNNGSLGGDTFDFNLGYALMGNGDGTFRGAPVVPFAYTGTNLGALTGGNAIDAVGVNSNGSFTSYLNNGAGSFSTGPSLTFSPITLSGTPYTLGIDSYAVGDINGDGFADLVYLGSSFYGPGFTPGIFIATGKGDGSFNAPVFVPAPPFIQAPDIDVNPTISGIRLADFNHDGKLDIIYTYSTTSYNTHTDYFGVAVELGNGNGAFQTPAQLTQIYSGSTFPNPGAYQIGLIGNVNSDVYPDMLMLSGLSENSQSFTLQVYLGTGTGAFGAPTTVAGVTPGGADFGGEWAPLLLADMNNDRIPDIVALQMDPVTQNLQIAIALGNGNGTFKTPNTTTFGSQYLNGTSLAVADFNGDGNLDVATTSFIGPSESGISFGNGNGTLQTGGSSSNLAPAQTLYVGGFAAAIALDLNGDGLPDILDGSVELLNRGTSTVTTSAATSTALASSVNPSTVGQQVTFTATVTSGTAGTPTGTVTFYDSSTQLGTGSLNSQAIATYPTSTLALGTHSITAQYGGDSNFSGSVSSPALSQVVNQAVALKPSATAVVSSLNPELGGQSVTFTATVTSTAGGTPTGMVTFFNGSTQIGSPATLSGNSTFVATSTLPLGSDSITASYGGDANYSPSASASPLTETVNVAEFAAVSGVTSVTAGQTATINLTFYQATGSNLAFTFSCVGIPAKSSCQFLPNPSAGSFSGTLVQMMFLTSSSKLPPSPSDRSPWPWILPGISAALAALFAAAGMIRWPRAPRRRLAFGLGLAGVALAATLVGCASSGSSGSSTTYTGTPKGQANFTVTAQSGGTTVSTPVSVLVQ